MSEARRKLIVALTGLREDAGNPSLRAIAELTDGAYSHTTVNTAFSPAQHLPSWRAVETIVVALDGDPADYEPLWAAADVESRAASKSVESAINESLIADRDAAQKERDDMRALLTRPTNVVIKAPEEDTLKKIGEHLPKLSQMPEHLATIAGELIKAAKARDAADSVMLQRIDRLAGGIDRIADVLERLAPVPADIGDDQEDQVTDRFVHVDPEGWSTPPVWEGRVCKRYGMAWTVFDPGPNDPISAGEACSIKHAPGREV